MTAFLTGVAVGLVAGVSVGVPMGLHGRKVVRELNDWLDEELTARKRATWMQAHTVEELRRCGGSGAGADDPRWQQQVCTICGWPVRIVDGVLADHERDPAVAP